MRLLALSTSSPALSIALFEAGALVAHRHEVIGRGHAEALLPGVAALLGRGRADAVIVDIGPGSFTGIRVGIAAARALGLAWGVPVTGCGSAALVAARAFAMRGDIASVTVVLDAGRGQLLVQCFGRDFTTAPMASVAAEGFRPADVEATAGGAAPASAGRIHAGDPDVRWALALPAAQRGLAPVAHYVRPPDAVLPL